MGSDSEVTMPTTPLTTGPTSAEPIDATVITGLREIEAAGGEPLLAPLVAAFLADATRRSSALAEALARGDRDALQLHAHGLKGSAAALGVVRAANFAAQLEHEAATASLQALGAMNAQLNEALAQAEPALRAIAAPAMQRAT